MTVIDNDMLWRQFGASIDMLNECLRDCLDELWEKSLWENRWVGSAGSVKIVVS